MKKKDRIYAFACSNQHVKVHSDVLRENIIFAGSRSKVESKRHVIYKGSEIMIMLKALQQGMTSEGFRKVHEVKRVFAGTMLYSKEDALLHLYTKRALIAKDRREHPSSRRPNWSERVRAQPPRRPSKRPAHP